MMNKKSIFLVLAVCFITLFSATSVLAFDFDNTYEYFDEVNTAIIHNCDIWVGWCWNEGEVLAEVTLTSPPNKLVPMGEDMLVGEFNLTTMGDFEDVFGELYLTDMKNGNEISRGKQYKYKKYTNVSVDDYGTICENVTDGNGTWSNCTKEEIGSHWEIQMDWTPIINPTNTFYSGITYEIGVFVDVEKWDYGDWIPEILGVKIPEWAEWSQSDNVGIEAYYRLDEALGNASDATGDNVDGVAVGITYGNAGIIGDSFTFDAGTNDLVDLNYNLAGTSFTMNAWIYPVSNLGVTSYRIIDNYGTSDGVSMNFASGFPIIYMGYGTGVSTPTATTDMSGWTNGWHMVTLTYDDSDNEIDFYLNGSNDLNSTLGGNIDWGSLDLQLGNRPGADRGFPGRIDGVGIWNRRLSRAEILNIFNSGLDGNEYQQSYGVSPSVTLTSPANNSNLTSSLITFVTTVTDDIQVENVSLFIDGVLNQTNSSEFNGSYTFTQTVAEGVHNWSILAYDNDSISNQSETRIFNYTGIRPVVTLTSPANNSNLTSSTVEFISTVTDDIKVKNVSLYLDGILNQTNVSGFNGSYTFTQIVAEGVHNWNIFAYDNNSFSTQSVNWTFNYTQPAINIELNNPSDSFVSKIPLVNFNCSADDPLGVEGLNLSIDGIVNETVTNVSIAENLTLSKNINLTEGIYIWGCQAYNSIKNAASSNRTLNVSFPSPVVTLISPANNSNVSSQNISFTVNVTVEDELSNVKFYINDILEQTNSSSVNGTYIFTESFVEGLYNWTINATSALGKVTTSDTLFINVTFTPPEITLISPANNTNVTNLNVPFVFNVTDGNGVANVSLYINGLLNETNTSGVNGSYILTKTLIDGLYNWSVASTSIFGSQTTSAVWDFLLHTTVPNATMIAPSGLQGYFLLGENETLSYNFSEPGENLTEHLDDCWYSYNGANVSLNCTATSTSFLYVNGINNMLIYVNDTFGFTDSDTSTWSYNLIEISQTYATSSVESATEIYTANVTYNSSNHGVITGTLYINGDSFLGTRTGSGDYALFTADAIMPAVTEETNYSAYWTIGLTNATGETSYNLTSNNVTVVPIFLGLCNATNNISFWNFTILNETNIVEINSTFEATFAVRNIGSTEDNTFSYADVNENNSQYDFCMSPGNQNYEVDTSIKLTKSGYVDKFYNYQDVILSNATREDNLYMMVSGDSTSFIVHVVYVDSSDVEGAEVRVQRYYQGTGLWLTTEILTTNDVGEAVGHFLAEDANYRFLVYQDGVSIHNSSATQITCAAAPCTVTLVIPIIVPSGTETISDLESSLTYSDTTNVFTYTYSDSSGDFSSARLEVFRIFPTNSTRVYPCNETKTTAAGVITCDITGQLNGTYRASGYITRDSDETLAERIDGVLGNFIYNSMGEDGVLWSIFILIGIVMIGLSRPSLAIIFGTFGLIFLGLTGIVNIGALSIVAVASVGIILLMRVGRE